MNSIWNYKTIIADLDGTLYWQKPVRRAMLREMAANFWKISDFLIVKKYRKMYEEGLDEKARLNKLPERAPSVIKEWMINRPLKHIAKYRDNELINLLIEWQKHGGTVIVCSDYPVKEKLTSLLFTPDYAYDANSMACMKPDAAGLIRLLCQQNINPNECLVIGDRYEKDGILAENMEADYVILPPTKSARESVYKQWRDSNQRQ